MKILPNNIAVIEGDTHISKWVEDHGRLNIAKEMLAPFRKYVKPGGKVIDVGANIGDHTITYAEWVGATGSVYAFEPNEEAFRCLVHNMANFSTVFPMAQALAEKSGRAELVRQDNAGASYLTGVGGSIRLRALDDYMFQSVDFIKIDAEGYETKILRGSAITIKKCRPVMLIEVNLGALVRVGSSRDELIDILESMNYSVEITDNRLRLDDPQYDVICVPEERES